MTAKDHRIYMRLTVDYADSPKIAALSDKAFRTHVEMIAWSRRLLTNGFIPAHIVRRWRASAVRELRTNGFGDVCASLSVVSGGYLLHDFLDHQQSREEVAAASEAKRSAGSKGGLAKARNAAEGSKDVAAAIAAATDVLPSKDVALFLEEKRREKKDLTTRAPAGADAPRKPPAAVAHALFEIAWLHWPKKVDKKRAEEKFLLALRRHGGTPQELVDAITAHGDAFEATTPTQFVPGLPKWLAGDQWTDPLAVPDAPRSRRLSRPEENYLGGRSGDELENLPDPFAPRGKPPMGEILQMRERS